MSQWFLVCAWCKEWTRRPDEVTWHPIKTIDAAELQAASISHGICPSCSEAFFNKNELSSGSEAGSESDPDQVDHRSYAKYNL